MIYLASTNSDKENKFRLLIFLLYKTRIRACLALYRHYSLVIPVLYSFLLGKFSNGKSGIILIRAPGVIYDPLKQ